MVMVDAVANQDADNDLEARMYGELLRKLNSDYFMTPLYGVHGIDDNPRDNPLADKDVLCSACGSHDDCGGQGNLCVGLEGGSFCATKCQTNDDCPGGYACYNIAQGGTIVSRNCVRTSLSCE